jgi:outer membrane receptor protein involved in Fe transport
MPLGRFFSGLVVAFSLTTIATPGAAQTLYRFKIQGGELTSSLNELAHQANIGLLFDPSLTEMRSAPPLEGRLTVAACLTRLLAGTGLSFREMSQGAFVVFAPFGAPISTVKVVTTVPEILVVGRRSQDADIRRSENDIQPYHVEDAHDIEISHADNVDDFLRSRLSSNAEIVSPLQDPNGQLASTRSEINLHGLGASQTLVLIDGRRMASLPTSGDNLLQPDLNGIPLSAVDRIEILTSTAGGIYGPGATGGVVNVILKHDYRGVDLNVGYGETERGDASRTQIDGRFGFTLDHGQTDVSLSLSRAVASPLTVSDRSYQEQSLQLISPNRWTQYLGNSAILSSIFISSNAGNLTLKPGYGGASLGSTFSFLPLGYGGLTADGGSRLSANAGMLPTMGSPSSLESNPTVTSLLFNVRHHFSDAVEAYLDVIDLQNNGHADASRSVSAGLSATAPNNPFNQYVNLIFPLPGFDASITTRTHMLRVSSGLILSLPFGWKADVDYSGGIASQDTRLSGSTVSDDFYASIYSGTAGANGRPALNPLGDWASFMSALQAYRLPTAEHIPLTNHLADGSLRLAGPIAQLPAGPVTLSLLAEERQEDVSASTSSSTNLVSDGTQSTPTPRLRQGVSSLYGELRAPLTPTNSSFLPLRGLEGQLAIRYDSNTTVLPANLAAEALNATFVTARQSAVVYTAGLKIQPLPALMLRSSVATGVLPPAIDQLGATIGSVYGVSLGADPERGGREIGSEQPITVLSGGSTSLQPEDSRSISVGAVIEPGGSGGPRLSIDFTRIDKTHEISEAYDFNVGYFLSHVAAYPGRVVRAPLTPADAALGFTGGVITQIDTTSLNIGSTVVETLDLGLDYAIDLPLGQLKIRAMGTWQPVFKQRSGPAFPWIDTVGYNDGPLEWRGNGAVEWSTDRFSVGLNVQYYDHYQIASSSPLTASDVNKIVSQGAVWIPSQTYVDFFSTYRFSLPDRGFLPRALELRFGIEDIFDTAPPIVTDYAFQEGYSAYGDPRRRRFDLKIDSRF